MYINIENIQDNSAVKQITEEILPKANSKITNRPYKYYIVDEKKWPTDKFLNIFGKNTHTMYIAPIKNDGSYPFDINCLFPNEHGGNVNKNYKTNGNNKDEEKYTDVLVDVIKASELCNKNNVKYGPKWITLKVDSFFNNMSEFKE